MYRYVTTAAGLAVFFPEGERMDWNVPLGTTLMLLQSSYLGFPHMSNTFITHRVALGIQQRN